MLVDIQDTLQIDFENQDLEKEPNIVANSNINLIQKID